MRREDRNEEEQQPETLPMTEEPWPTSLLSPENNRSAYNIIVDEKKSYRELRKLLNNN